MAWTEPANVTTGLPQESPISPVLFAVYISYLDHRAVEGQVEQGRGISFMDDVTWIVEGDGMSEVVHRLERYAAASLRCANNAARPETSKAEAVLFPRRPKRWQQKATWWASRPYALPGTLPDGWGYG